MDVKWKKIITFTNESTCALNLTDDTSEVERIIANAKIDYDFPLSNNLTATLSIGVDESEGIGVSYTDPLIPTDELGFNGSGELF
ncbi:MAG: hypothetical protein CM15mP32_6030 [Flavobacteriaceae bacterium]|nr:MAG: hypothetical protein CM15mP32_6030 [Flavobacteriaceae bacterium]